MCSLPSTRNELQVLAQVSPRSTGCVLEGRQKTGKTGAVSRSRKTREWCPSEWADELGSGWVGLAEDAVMQSGH